MRYDDKKRDRIIEGLSELANKFSLENDSNTPDFLIAEHLIECLETYNTAIQRRNKYYDNQQYGHVINPMNPMEP